MVYARVRTSSDAGSCTTICGRGTFCEFRGYGTGIRGGRDTARDSHRQNHTDNKEDQARPHRTHIVGVPISYQVSRVTAIRFIAREDLRTSSGENAMSVGSVTDPKEIFPDTPTTFSIPRLSCSRIGCGG